MQSPTARVALTIGLAIIVLLGLSTLLAAAFRGSPDGKVVMAVGGSNGQYLNLAEAYQADLVKYGVDVQLRPSVEGFPALRALVDDTSGVHVAFVKGGLVGSLQGRLAGTKAKDWQERELGKLRSLGRLFHEPVWVFVRKDVKATTLRELKDRKILTGTREGGTRRIAGQLLRANGIQLRNNPLNIEGDLDAEGTQLTSGAAEAAILILPADAERIQKLLRNPAIRLLDFSSEADAYINRFPALTKVTLRRGAVEFDPLTPPEDITLLSTSAVLVARSDLHPAVMSMLANAVLNNPRPGFDKSGDPVLFYRAGEFPSASDPEFQVSEETRQVYKAGDLPFVLRVVAPIVREMGLPFSVAAFANAHGAQTILLLIPSLAILVPLMRLIPMLYTWTMRRRLLYWYRQLKSLEGRLEGETSPAERAGLLAEIERIDSGVMRIKVPLHFSDQFYDLRGHIDLVRQRLAKPAAVRMAAE